MPIQKVTLQPHGWEVDALTADGLALHPQWGERHKFAVTHVKTGLAVVQGVTWDQALNVLAGIAESGIDFSFSDAKEALRIRPSMVAVLAAAGLKPGWATMEAP